MRKGKSLHSVKDMIKGKGIQDRTDFCEPSLRHVHCPRCGNRYYEKQE